MFVSAFASTSTEAAACCACSDSLSRVAVHSDKVQAGSELLQLTLASTNGAVAVAFAPLRNNIIYLIVESVSVTSNQIVQCCNRKSCCT
jgi:hypothetical protein